MRDSRGGPALVGAVLLLLLLRVVLRMARHGSHVGRVAVVLDVVLILALVTYAVVQNKRSR